MHVASGLPEFHKHQTDNKCNSGNNLKAQQRFHANPTHTFHAAHTRNARNDGAENNRRDHHFNEIDKAFAQRLHFYRGIGEVVTKPYTQQNGDNDLKK